METTSTVFIVDDDEGMRRSVELLMMSANLPTMCFSSAQEFLNFYDGTQPGCVILDLKMPGMCGDELQQQLLKQAVCPPIIFVSAHGDIATAVRTMKLGSYDFIEKPYSSQYLIERVITALDIDREARAREAKRREMMAQFSRLSRRETEVMEMVVAGLPSKVIASELQLSVSTVDNHRARVMKKLGAETSSDLTRLVLSAQPSLIEKFKNSHALLKSQSA